MAVKCFDCQTFPSEKAGQFTPVCMQFQARATIVGFRVGSVVTIFYPKKALDLCNVDADSVGPVTEI